MNKIKRLKSIKLDDIEIDFLHTLLYRRYKDLENYPDDLKNDDDYHDMHLCCELLDIFEL